MFGGKLANKTAEEFVWYCCYGSNLNQDRFRTYIHGGTPKYGLHIHIGCRDRSDPMESHFTKLPHIEMFFAKESRFWNGGGSAFIRKATSIHESRHTVVRMYLIRVQQFIDVVAQENMIHDREKIALLEQYFLDDILTKCKQFPDHDFQPIPFLEKENVNADLWYDMLVYLGRKDGYPIFSFTNYEMSYAAEHEIFFNPPSAAYLHTIYKGLKEGNVFDEEEEYIRYFMDKKGLQGVGTVSRQMIAEYLNSQL
jgi:hypothetical protein